MIVPPLTRGTDVASPHVPGVHECTPNVYPGNKGDIDEQGQFD